MFFKGILYIGLLNKSFIKLLKQKIMKTITTLSRMILCAFILSFCFIYSSVAQTQVAVIREWLQHFANQDSIMESPAAVDKYGNYYVAGYTLDATTGPDITVVKYDREGNVI
jgi:hypothetical protein